MRDTRAPPPRGAAAVTTIVLACTVLCTPAAAHTLTFGDYSYTVAGSSAAFTVWTTATSHKINPSHEVPTPEKTNLFMSAARNEYEPLQVIIKSTSGGACTATWTLPGAQKVTFHKGGYVDDLLDTLTPIATTFAADATEGTISLDAGKHTVLWVTIYVPHDMAAKGTVMGSLKLAPASGAAMDIPVELYVFDFQVSGSLNFVNTMTISLANVMDGGGSNPDAAKQILFDHRMTSKGGATWPSGFNYQVAYETDANPDKCSKFFDEPDEQPQYSLHHLAPKFIKGEDWNCVGFPSHMAVQFVDNNTPRPKTFCGESVGADPKGTTAYNAAWGKYIKGLGEYVVANNLQDKVWYYTMNEPQNTDDYETAIALCKLAREVAPGLMITLSEEPKPEIAEQCAYDIWAAAFREFDQEYAWKRMEQGIPGERVWLYSLPQDPDPYPNPSQASRQGMHARILGFLSWSLRTQGYWYYDADTWFTNKNPTVRLELFREAWEDYEYGIQGGLFFEYCNFDFFLSQFLREFSPPPWGFFIRLSKLTSQTSYHMIRYLWLANGKKQPKPCTLTAADVTSFSVAKGMTDWTSNDDALMSLRHQLGLYLEGSISTPPELVLPPSPPPAPLYINFQDPAGSPSADPLDVNGQTWLKMGWQAYDPNTGIGWEGENIGKSIVKTGYKDIGGLDETLYSYIYDDYGRDNVFKYPLNPGVYDITVAVGVPGKLYGDKYNVVVNGVKVIDNYDSKGVGVAQTKETITMEITDGLSVVWGGKDDTGAYAYTFINYLTAVPSSAPPGTDHPAELICAKLSIPLTDQRTAEPACRPCQVDSPVCTSDTPAPTAVPTTAPLTDAPATNAPLTDAPATAIPTAAPTKVPLAPMTTYAPDTTAPATAVPTTSPATDTTAPATSIPDTRVPLVAGTTYPPDTTAPDTTAPETSIPDTRVPLVPGTTYAPDTGAPETDAPTRVPLKDGETYAPVRGSGVTDPPDSDDDDGFLWPLLWAGIAALALCMLVVAAVVVRRNSQEWMTIADMAFMDESMDDLPDQSKEQRGGGGGGGGAGAGAGAGGPPPTSQQSYTL